MLAGLLEGEVRALKQRKTDYDEARRQSDGSDSCWSGADSDTDSAAELKVVSEPSALEGAAAERGEVEPLRPRGLAPKNVVSFLDVRESSHATVPLTHSPVRSIVDDHHQHSLVRHR